MALGRPVLAANVNGVPELMEHMKTGYIFEPLSVNAITQAIEFAIENHKSDKMANWCLAAKNHIAQNFTVEKMVDKLEDYFHYHYNLENRK